jgi:hypothetical protein
MVLLGMQNRALGPYVAAMHRMNCAAGEAVGAEHRVAIRHTASVAVPFFHLEMSVPTNGIHAVTGDTYFKSRRTPGVGAGGFGTE